MAVTPPTIKWIGCHPSNYASGRQGVKPEALVLHVAQGTLAGTDDWFNRQHPTGQESSSHFCVGKDGMIHQYVKVADTAFGNGIIEAGATARLIHDNLGLNPNLWTCSIEHEGFSGNPVPQVQLLASVRLSAWLFDTVLLPSGASGVKVDRDHILKHPEITPVTRGNCPGWSEQFQANYISMVRSLLAPPPDLEAIKIQLDALWGYVQDERDRLDSVEQAIIALKVAAGLEEPS